MTKRESKRTAFTLVEVLLAIGVFVIGVLALFGAFSLAMKLTQYAREVSTATNLAEEKMEVVRNTDFGNLAVNANPTAESTPKLPDGFTKTYVELYQGSDRIKEVTVTVYWRSRPESNAINLTTLISQGGISD